MLRDSFAPHSDVDLLVQFDPRRYPSLMEVVAMEGELSPIFEGRKVDLRTPFEISGHYRDAVLASAEVVYVSR